MDTRLINRFQTSRNMCSLALSVLDTRAIPSGFTRDKAALALGVIGVKPVDVRLLWSTITEARGHRVAGEAMKVTARFAADLKRAYHRSALELLRANGIEGCDSFRMAKRLRVAKRIAKQGVAARNTPVAIAA